MRAVSPHDEFKDLIRRVRGGDPEAARALVEGYESVIRRVVRHRLADPRLRAAFDSVDVCQSVLGSFFVRAANGEYDLDTPEQLTHLLARMAQNRLATYARRQAAGKRDYRRAEAAGDEHAEVPAAGPTPSREVAARDLLRAVRERLTPDERRLADLRQAGLDWAEIAVREGDNPAALRKRLSRAMDRVSRELGLDDAGE